jgi:magnesium-transporting ATPase (P-type)
MKSAGTPPAEAANNHWHALSVEEALQAVRSTADAGLTAAEAQRRLERWGPNALPEPERRSLVAVFVGQFRSPLIYLLFAAAALALALGHISDAAVIFVVVLLNAVIGAMQEGRADRSLEALRRITTHRARVVRDGQQSVIEARDVVIGDLLVLEAGDAVAADARLLHGAALQLAEAALTGESVPVGKSLVPLAEDTLLADRRNMIYAGTHVTAGRALALVIATGLNTEIGHIARLAEAAAQPKTPLERRIDQFGRYVMIAAAVIFVLVNAIGYLRGVPFGTTVMVAISQVVGMIPEGLPVAMTIALAIGVQRMARRKAVVRQLAAVETLGSTTIICSDKTGTLTRNEMTVAAIVLPDGRELSVTGVGYEPQGAFLEGDRELTVSEEAPLRGLLEAAVLCNDAQLRGPTESEPGWKPIGDPTEVALIAAAIKAGIIPEHVRSKLPRRAELPFDAASKMMATQHETSEGSRVIVKGAPEVILAHCSSALVEGQDRELTEDARRSIQAAADRLASRALRVLAIGVVENAELDGREGFGALRGRVVLLGLIGQLDPPRMEAADAVMRCRKAGIRPVMVTGDHKATAFAIAKAVGIAEEGSIALDGRELSEMSDAELASRIDSISVFARVHPAQKLRIVEAYQRRNEVVAMTGDGVNDAPALVKADVGVAMGIAGTEVAKESAKIVIADDNFATIVAAIEEGRVVYRNIKKAVLLLFSTSAAEVSVLLLAMLLGYPPPFVAVQILWNNLITEGLITVNLVMEAPEGDEMQARPIAPDEPLLSRLLLTRMGVMVPAMIVSTLGWFIARSHAGIPEAQVRTETFTLLAVCEWFNVLNCRSDLKSAFTRDLLKNHWLLAGLVTGNLLQIAVVFWPPFNRLFHTVPFGLDIVVALGVVGSLVLWAEEARKLLARRRQRRLGVAA